MSKAKPKRPWKMPDWMKAHLPIAGCDDPKWIAELVNDETTNVVVNAPRAMQCVAVKCQVQLLERLYEHGWLRPWPED